MTRECEDLTGVWQGLYSYPALLRPIGFTATLLHSGARLSGTTHETAQEEAGDWVEVMALLDGRCAGRHVNFVKTYDGTNGWVHEVHYSGVLNHDATEIEGRWSLPGFWDGKFLMMRVGMDHAEQITEVFAEV